MRDDAVVIAAHHIVLALDGAPGNKKMSRYGPEPQQIEGYFYVPAGLIHDLRRAFDLHPTRGDEAVPSSRTDADAT